MFRLAAATVVSICVGIGPATVAEAFPGVNGPIIWESETGSTGDDADPSEIWIMNPDGSAKTPLTDNTFGDENPAVSADGQHVAFQSWRTADSSQEIYTMNINGSDQTPLTDNATPDLSPSWSPDGTQIIWVRDGDIWKIDASGANAVNLTNTPLAFEESPEFSPDGTKIAYVDSGHTDGNPSGTSTTRNVWKMDSDGTDPVQLTFDSGFAVDIEPTWSPDGTRIAFGHNGNTTNLDTEMWVMDADGSDAGLVADDVYSYASAWSPDGSLLVYQGDGEILTSPPIFGVAEPTNLTDSSVSDHSPSWAPAALPDTKITSGPGAVIHKNKASFKFKAIPPSDASFECALDARAFKECESPKVYRRLKNGRHDFKVRAVGPGGKDPSPASALFKVKAGG